MTIKFLAHASFLITSEDGVRIITDPYESGGYNGALRYGPITDEADIVTVSHDHADHNYVAGVPGNPVVVTEYTEVSGISFRVIGSYHDNAQGAERGPNRIFCFAVDGIRVCHLGDLGHLLSAEQASSIGDVDVLLIPVGGHFTIDAQSATQVIDQLQPSIVIPMHYKTPKVDFPIAPVDEFLAGKQNVERAGTSQVTVRADELGEGPQIIVLEAAN